MLDLKTLLFAAPVAALLLTGCDNDDGPPPLDAELVAEGQSIYEAPVEGGNTFACATCHAMDESEGRRLVGHPLGGATSRDSFKNGQLDAFEDAANSCLSEWMNADPWEAEDPRMVSLRTFVQSGGGAEDSIEFEILQTPTALAGGNPDAGREMFNASCAECHGQDGQGTQQAISVASGALEPGYIARRVRTSGQPGSEVYDGLSGGVMPFWSAERLSETELLDIVAYLSRDYDPTPVDPDPMDPDDPDDPVDPDDPMDPDDPDDPMDPDDPKDPVDPVDPSGCAATHPKVGQTAELQMLFHDVGGIAEIIDNCTIEIRDFDFDGEGIDVQIYGGFENMYDDGFSISDDLVRDMPYNGEVLTLTLPEGRSLDEIGGVSVWCVPIGADFGSGTFQ